MAQDLEKMQSDPRPRGGKRVGAEVWYDVSLKMPLGVRLDEAESGEVAVGVSEVFEGGSVYEHNEEVTFAKKNFVQPGDRLIQVNGKSVKTQNDAVALITSTPEGGKVALKFARSSMGPIKVFFPEPAIPVVVPAKSKLSDVARNAGHDVTYSDACGGGEDGERCDGACWHLNNATGDIYQLCNPSCLASEIPGSGGVKNLDKQLFGLAAAVANVDVGMTTWPNTEPLVLIPCPDLAKKLNDPYIGRWQYWNGKYRISRTEEGERLFEEDRISGILREEGEWLVADLTTMDGEPQGSIRLRPGENKGISVDLDSQYRAEGSDEWQETVTAFDLGAAM